ncbi:hypothetical protein HMPREF2586_00265 [Staphylococcus sp. HMSC034G07]|uniref:hypothetical protein n=1 Tax=Staphylococcus sp. HMSC034G07 TaxID=1715065 RepID=UPI0008A87912|nr:hypothetical protein [Staphylococcus sp. HMSC034G07]OHO38969.1 hypothetical protein HMPREF2586_00265 [Staphylococcus sp. HMSC034G07]
MERKEELVVLLDEFKEVKGIFEMDNEICELFDYYILELTKDIQSQYTIDEQLYYHFDSLGKLSQYYNSALCSEKDINDFLKNYNEIAPVKLNYEIVSVEDEVEMQEFISYVNEVENGYQKYKDNNYHVPTPTVVVIKPDKETPEQDTMESRQTKTESNMEEILETLINFEITSLQRNYNANELMYMKTDYIRDLFEICYKLKNGIKSKYDLLLDFQSMYNFEYEFSNQEITIKLV